MRSCRAGISSCLLTKGNKKSRGEFPATPARPCGSSKQRATTQPVRRAFPNSPAHAVSNTWKGSFFVAAHATAMRSNKKSPHEPRNQILRALPWPTESYLRRSLFSTQICFVKPIFAHRMLLRSRWLKSQNSSHANPSSTETLTEGQGSRALRLLRGS